MISLFRTKGPRENGRLALACVVAIFVAATLAISPSAAAEESAAHVAAAPAPTPLPALPPAPVPAAGAGAEARPLSPGDSVFLDVYRRPELSGVVQVDGNGSVSLPYVGW